MRGHVMHTLTLKYAQLGALRRIRVGATCDGHDFTDVPVATGQRLGAHEMQCARCTLIVPIIAAWLYEMGKRHGAVAGPDSSSPPVGVRPPASGAGA